ncbi:MAG: hypothetical protein HKL80_00630 [Acidimicrobiales bacterium]|nr:hypothetical protein [Acidimicrobiales bacterium]
MSEAPKQTSENKLKYRLGWGLIALLLISAVGLVVLKPAPMSVTQRAQALDAQIRCPACEGQSVLDSSAPIAVDIRAEVLNDIQAGQSNSEIMTTLEGAYGSGISLAPTGSALASLAWWFPIGLIVAVILFLIGVGLKRRLQPENDVVIETKSDKRSQNYRVLLGAKRKLLFRGALFSFALAALYVAGLMSGLKLPGAKTSSNEIPVSKLLTDARNLSADNQEQAALAMYSQVLSIDPKNAYALSEQGWLVSQSGEANHDPALVEIGQAEIQKAIEIDSNLAEARLYLGTILFNDDDQPSQAVVQFQSFLADHPSQELIDAGRSQIILAYKADNKTPPLK